MEDFTNTLANENLYDVEELCRLKAEYAMTKSTILSDLKREQEAELTKRLATRCSTFSKLLKTAYDIAVELYTTTNKYIPAVAFEKYSWTFDIDICPEAGTVVVNLTDKYCNAHAKREFPIRLLYLPERMNITIKALVDMYRKEQFELHTKHTEEKEYNEYLRLKAKYENQ